MYFEKLLRTHFMLTQSTLLFEHLLSHSCLLYTSRKVVAFAVAARHPFGNVGGVIRIQNPEIDRLAGVVAQHLQPGVTQRHVAVKAFEIGPLGLRLDHHSHAGTEWVPQGGLSFLLPHNAQIKRCV